MAYRLHVTLAARHRNGSSMSGVSGWRGPNLDLETMFVDPVLELGCLMAALEESCIGTAPLAQQPRSQGNRGLAPQSPICVMTCVTQTINGACSIAWASMKEPKRRTSWHKWQAKSALNLSLLPLVDSSQREQPSCTNVLEKLSA